MSRSVVYRLVLSHFSGSSGKGLETTSAMYSRKSPPDRSGPFEAIAVHKEQVREDRSASPVRQRGNVTDGS
jgi:hypothetical protein